MKNDSIMPIPVKFWKGSRNSYNNLNSYDANTKYSVVEPDNSVTEYFGTNPVLCEPTLSKFVPNTGYTVSALTLSTGDTMSQAFAKIQQQIDVNDVVLAKALNDLNTNIKTSVSLKEYQELTTGTTESELAVNSNDTILTAIQKLQRQILINEITISRALNDLNERINQLSS